jgi:hypothetical protein
MGIAPDEAWRARLSRAARPDRAATPRDRGAPAVLVNVLPPGASVTPGPLVFFRGNPVTLTGAEVEGGAATREVDTDTVIPVLPLGTSPRPNTDVVATFARHRWVTRVAYPTGGGPPICGYICGIASNCCRGITMTVKLGGTVIGTCDVSGSPDGQGCCVPITATGTYTVTFSAAGYLDKVVTVVAGACDGRSYWANGGCLALDPDRVLCLTDPDGNSISLTKTGTDCSPTWTGSHTYTASEVATDCIELSSFAHRGPGPVTFHFAFTCSGLTITYAVAGTSCASYGCEGCYPFPAVCLSNPGARWGYGYYLAEDGASFGDCTGAGSGTSGPCTASLFVPMATSCNPMSGVGSLTLLTPCVNNGQSGIVSNPCPAYMVPLACGTSDWGIARVALPQGTYSVAPC